MNILNDPERGINPVAPTQHPDSPLEPSTAARASRAMVADVAHVEAFLALSINDMGSRLHRAALLGGVMCVDARTRAQVGDLGPGSVETLWRELGWSLPEYLLAMADLILIGWVEMEPQPDGSGVFRLEVVPELSRLADDIIILAAGGASC